MRKLWGLGVTALAVGCGSPPTDPPTAVVRSDPASVCLDDNFETPLYLDASESSPSITLVPVPSDPDAPSLEFEWSFSGADYEELGRDPTGVSVRVATKGDRPLHVGLLVRNQAGGEATTTLSVPITIPELVLCEAGACPADMQCVPYSNAGVCVPSAPCEYDSDCEVCFRCNTAASLCMPREGIR